MSRGYFVSRRDGCMADHLVVLRLGVGTRSSVSTSATARRLIPCSRRASARCCARQIGASSRGTRAPLTFSKPAGAKVQAYPDGHACLRLAAVAETLRDHRPFELREHAGHLAHGGAHRVVGVVLRHIGAVRREDATTGCPNRGEQRLLCGEQARQARHIRDDDAVEVAVPERGHHVGEGGAAGDAVRAEATSTYSATRSCSPADLAMNCSTSCR